MDRAGPFQIVRRVGGAIALFPCFCIDPVSPVLPALFMLESNSPRDYSPSNAFNLLLRITQSARRQRWRHHSRQGE